jgi:hypothetical protein
VVASGQLILPCQEAPPAQEQKQPEAEELRVPGSFHITGARGVKHNARGDLVITGQKVLFVHGKPTPFEVPLARVRRVVLLHGERHYPKATYGMAVAFGAPGALLIFKKRQVDALDIEFTNERGGIMEVLFHIPRGQAEPCGTWLMLHGVTVEEPPAAAEPAEKK